MSHKNHRRGLVWGYGLGLLSLLVVVGLMLWMTGRFAGLDSGVPGSPDQPSYRQAIDQARSVTQAADKHNEDLDAAARNAAPKTGSMPAPSGANR